MTTPQVTLFVLFAAVLSLMLWGRWRYDLVAFAGLVAGVLLGLVPAEEAFTGFSNPATVIVALILIVTAGLQRAGVIAMLARMLRGEQRPIWKHISLLGGVGALMSGFMNNVAALAILMPIDLRMARKLKRSAHLTLMPLSFATILGGMLTLIGTPPNLLVSQARETYFGEGFRMFDFLPVGGTVAAVGVLFVALLGWRLIPRHAGDDQSTMDSHEKLRDFVSVLLLDRSSSAEGQTMAEMTRAAREAEVVILAVERGGKRFYRTTPALVLMEGDRLVIEASPEAIEEFRTAHALDFPEGGASVLPDGAGRVLVEAVVPESSRIIGRRAGAVFLGQRSDTVLLGIQREGQTLRDKLGDKRIRMGDVLLLLMPEDQAGDTLDPMDLLPLDDRATAVTRETRLWSALGVFVVAIALTSLGVVPMAVALGTVVVVYVLLGVLTLDTLYDHVDWPIIVLLGSMIPLGMALDSTGGAALIARAMEAATSGFPPWVALVLLMSATMFVSDVLNNNATTVLAAPIAIRLAAEIGVNPDAFLMGVAVAASCAFLTPIGHQNNTLILGPGGYRFGDYWRMGLPLEIIVLAVSVPMLLIVFPL